MKLVSATFIAMNEIKIKVNDRKLFDPSNIYVLNGALKINIFETIPYEDSFHIVLKENISVKDKTYICINNETYNVNYSSLYITNSFNQIFYYSGNLGINLTDNETSFKLWTPAASSVMLLLYKSGDIVYKETPLTYELKEANGIWHITIEENLEGYFYNYLVNVYGEANEVIDPYAIACGINGDRGAIIDLGKASPKDWANDISPTLTSYTDAIIYEASIRDMTMDINSGVKNKGLFLGLTEENTKNSKGLETGLDHIIDLGITHLQLMPIMDFSKETVDERNPKKKYNWGYNPVNFNIPEGSYSVSPYNPFFRIKELKELIYTLHKNNISINLDVVYNHTANEVNNNLDMMFPGYYYRLDEFGKPYKGSGCENDLASEHLMVRKLIIDSVLYIAEEYHVDGFRFDLMGLLDITTMNLIRASLDKNIMLYGEGWNIPSKIADEDRSTQYNSFKLPHIGFFNDHIRDNIKGSIFNIYDKGFANGRKEAIWELRRAVTGNIYYNDFVKGIYELPEQSINYASAHDNNTLWDKFSISNIYSSIEERKNMVKLSNAIILTSQGIPFLHGGEEFCRSKEGISNSYKSSDYINQMDWSRKTEFIDVFTYYKGLIELRKNHSAFKMNNPIDIRNNLFIFDNLPEGTFMFLLKDHANKDIWESILVIYYNSLNKGTLKLPAGSWKLVTNPIESGVKILEEIEGCLVLDNIGAYVLYK
ncbi:MAG TPA: type I pullulanase [Clostridiaceae bacterium]